MNRSLRAFQTLGNDKSDANFLFPPGVRAGDFVFVSGQASVDAAGAIVPGTFAEEMARSIDNVRRVLSYAGLSLAEVVMVTAYVDSPDDLAEYNQLYPTYFFPPRPARTTITSCLGGRVKFEIDVVAYMPASDGSVAESAASEIR